MFNRIEESDRIYRKFAQFLHCLCSENKKQEIEPATTTRINQYFTKQAKYVDSQMQVVQDQQQRRNYKPLRMLITVFRTTSQIT